MRRFAAAAAGGANADGEQHQVCRGAGSAGRRDSRAGGRRPGGRLQIDVSDTGPGFSLESAPSGHGLDNLRNRLAMLFGEHGGAAGHAADGWTTVRLMFPAAAPAAVQRMIKTFIVDDEPLALERLRRMLQATGTRRDRGRVFRSGGSGGADSLGAAGTVVPRHPYAGADGLRASGGAGQAAAGGLHYGLRPARAGSVSGEFASTT